MTLARFLPLALALTGCATGPRPYVPTGPIPDGVADSCVYRYERWIYGFRYHNREGAHLGLDECRSARDDGRTEYFRKYLETTR